MEGFLVFDTYRGRMVNVYHAKTYEAALAAEAHIKTVTSWNTLAFGEVTILHLDTVPSWESEEVSKNGEGAKTIQESQTRLI